MLHLLVVDIGSHMQRGNPRLAALQNKSEEMHSCCWWCLLGRRASHRAQALDDLSRRGTRVRIGLQAIPNELRHASRAGVGGWRRLHKAAPRDLVGHNLPQDDSEGEGVCKRHAWLCASMRIPGVVGSVHCRPAPAQQKRVWVGCEARVGRGRRPCTAGAVQWGADSQQPPIPPHNHPPILLVQGAANSSSGAAYASVPRKSLAPSAAELAENGACKISFKLQCSLTRHSHL